VEAKAGSIVIFSSLTPHMTGVNTTSETRKAYILQYAPEGSFLLKGDPNNGQPDNREAANEPDRQFVILKDGLPEV
jgi:ectoine hydroxylase-related dioxygenase (phytanoyl-CoA dioxygenase family)